MATAILTSNYLQFKGDAVTTYLKLHATANTLDFAGADDNTDVTVTGINQITATTITDGSASLNSGSLSGISAISASGDIVTSGGNITGNTITGTSLTTNSGAISGGALTVSSVDIGSGDLTTSGDASVGTLTSSGAVSGTTFTGTSFVIDGGATLSGTTLSGLSSPSADSHAVNKAYVDNLSSGLNWTYSVRVVSDSNGTLSTAFAAGESVDGVTLAEDDRILLIGQTTAAENGIYVVQASGAPVRPADFAAGRLAAATAVFVEEGTAYADAGFVCTTNKGSDVVDTDGLAFVQFSGAGMLTAGDGLSKTGNTLDVDATVVRTSGTQTIAGAKTFSDAAFFSNDVDVTGAATFDSTLVVTGNADFSGGIDIKTDGGALTVGAGADLSVVHDGTDTIMTSATGNLIVDNTNATGSSIFRLGTDDANTTFGVQNDSGNSRFSVDGLGDVSIARNTTVGGTLGVTGLSTLSTLNVTGAAALSSTLNVNGVTTITNTTGSTNKDTGCLVLDGGLGVEQNANVGGTLGVTGDATLLAALDVTGVTTINDTTGSTNKDTGCLVLGGGLGVEENANVGGSLGVTGDATLSAALNVTGVATFANTDDSTSSTTGSIITSGGIGAAKDIWSDGDMNAVAFNATSDQTFKENIEDLDASDFDKLLDIRSVKYNFIHGDGRMKYGILAQDLQEHELGDIVTDKGQSGLKVDYNNLVGLLIGKVKSMHSEIEDLKSKMNFLM